MNRRERERESRRKNLYSRLLIAPHARVSTHTKRKDIIYISAELQTAEGVGRERRVWRRRRGARERDREL